MKCIILFLVGSLLTGNAMAFEKKNIYGYVEKVILVEKTLTVSAKLDTGAKSSSLSAINIQRIERNGVSYLRFIVPNKKGDVELTAEYVGKVKIKARDSENGTLPIIPIKRPVVLIQIQMGGEVRTIPVNLTNRKRFLYPLLLGRDAIRAFSGLVDPSLVFTLKKEEVNKNEVK